MSSQVFCPLLNPSFYFILPLTNTFSEVWFLLTAYSFIVLYESYTFKTFPTPKSIHLFLRLHSSSQSFPHVTMLTRLFGETFSFMDFHDTFPASLNIPFSLGWLLPPPSYPNEEHSLRLSPQPLISVFILSSSENACFQCFNYLYFIVQRNFKGKFDHFIFPS